MTDDNLKTELAKTIVNFYFLKLKMQETGSVWVKTNHEGDPWVLKRNHSETPQISRAVKNRPHITYDSSCIKPGHIFSDTLIIYRRLSVPIQHKYSVKSCWHILPKEESFYLLTRDVILSVNISDQRMIGFKNGEPSDAEGPWHIFWYHAERACQADG